MPPPLNIKICLSSLLASLFFNGLINLIENVERKFKERLYRMSDTCYSHIEDIMQFKTVVDSR